MPIKDFTMGSPFQYLMEEMDSIENLTMPEYFLKKAQKFIDQGQGDFNWIVDTKTGESYNYNSYEKLTRNVASALYKFGMRKGDTLIHFSYNLVRLHLLQCGVWRSNGILRTSYPEDTLETHLERIIESKAKWLVCEKESASICLEISKLVDWKIYIFIADGNHEGCLSYDVLFDDDGMSCPPLEVKPEDPCMIKCTSGSSGKCKGAIYNHKNCLELTRKFQLIPKGEINLSSFKGTHISGFSIHWSTFCEKKQLLVIKKCTLEKMLKAIDKYKPTYVLSFPSMLLGMIDDPMSKDYDLSSVNYALSGGLFISPEIEKAMKEKLPNFKSIIIMYGLTEILPLTITSNLSNKTEYEIFEGIGKVFTNSWVQIRDPHTGEILGPNQQGEICGKTIGSFSCYLNNPEETEKSFYDKGEWFRTGDLGYFTEDGIFHYVERIKSIFKCGGNHVSPTELDSLLMQHSCVSEACVVGIKVPDSYDQEYWPRGYITIKKGSNVTAEEIKEFANKRLPNYKQLKGGVYIVKDLPKGFSGKISRDLVAKMAI